MIISELLEYGRKGFPGYGNRLFGQRHYEYMVMEVNGVSDTHAREWLIDWLCEVFRRDNGKFSPSRFKDAIAAKRQYDASPTFEQRHFYYLAQWVKEITDPHIHDFVRDWLADAVGGTNHKFHRSIWDQFCNKPQPTRPPNPATAEGELDEGPAYGATGHGGFGKRIFKPAHYRYIAADISGVSDVAIKKHLVEWFNKVFTLDNPAFPSDGFREAASAEASAPSPKGWDHRVSNEPSWQARHYYFLAHEVCDIDDIHEREFIADWLAEQIGSTNQYFQPERWNKYCNLPMDNYDRKAVRHYRAKATGATDIPPHPGKAHWEEWLAKHPERAEDYADYHPYD